MVEVLIISSILFCFGVFGMIFLRNHLLIVLISLELLLLASMINFVCFSIFLDLLIGQIYGLMILTIAASESAIGLAILIVYYRLRGGLSLDYIKLLKG